MKAFLSQYNKEIFVVNKNKMKISNQNLQNALKRIDSIIFGIIKFNF